jgi:plasmid stabilization system protein ParE
MKFELKKLPPAEADELAAALWYDEQQHGLGDDFLDAVEETVRSLTRDALLYRVRFAGVRRAPVRRFPFYGVFYTVDGPMVKILAIFHGRRHPRRLSERRQQMG